MGVRALRVVFRDSRSDRATGGYVRRGVNLTGQGSHSFLQTVRRIHALDSLFAWRGTLNAEQG